MFIDKPEFVINASTGKKILQWCNQDSSIENHSVISEIQSCKTLEQLRYVYSKYPELQQKLQSVVIKKKQELESLESQVIPNEEIINKTKNQQNGIDSSK